MWTTEIHDRIWGSSHIPHSRQFCPRDVGLGCILFSWKTCSWDIEQHQAMYEPEYDSWNGGEVAVLRDSLLSFGGVFL